MKVNMALIEDLKDGKIAVKFNRKENNQIVTIAELARRPLCTDLFTLLIEEKYLYLNMFNKLVVDYCCTDYNLKVVEVKDFLLPEEDKVATKFEIGQEYEFKDKGTWIRGKLLAIIEHYSPYVAITDRCDIDPQFYEEIREIVPPVKSNFGTRWMNYSKSTGQPISPMTYDSEQSAKLAAAIYINDSIQVKMIRE